MYEKIKADISNEYYLTNYPNDGQRFVAWYLRNIHNLDTYETKDCITDGAGDKQIDAIYIDNQSSTIYIIQGKFYGGDTVDAEPLREVLSSWVQIKDLEHLQDGANHKLQVKINEMASALEDDYEVCFELITTSTLTESAQNDLAAFQKELSENESLSANLVVVDNETMKFKYEEALHKNRPYINHEFKLESGKYMELMLMLMGCTAGNAVTIKTHGELAVKKGATIDEIGEVLRLVFFYYGASAVIPAVELFEELQEKNEK